MVQRPSHTASYEGSDRSRSTEQEQEHETNERATKREYGR